MTVKALKKQLMAAIAMVVVSAIALSSSTYAWFASNSVVTAQGMKVTAQAESGILIREKDSSADWSSTVSVTMDSAQLYPTSTNNLTEWWHATSGLYDNAQAQQAKAKYEKKTEQLDSYRLVKEFVIRSANTNADLPNKKLAVKTVTVTDTDASASSPALNKSVRVGVLVNEQIHIFAPLIDGDDFTLTPNYAETPTELVEYKVANITRDQFALTDNKIPAADNYLNVSVFMWFEGEDEDCKSSNITASMDELNLSIVFEAVDINSGS